MCVPVCESASGMCSSFSALVAAIMPFDERRALALEVGNGRRRLKLAEKGGALKFDTSHQKRLM